MTLDEQLSRLIDGDLTEEEAQALRDRIRREPDVARAYDEMTTLLAALSTLPETAPAPPLRVAPLRPARSFVAVAAPWIVAMAAALAWWITPGPPVVTIASGETRIAGDLSLLAGDVAIDLDGDARITVEEDDMTRQQVIAGIAGAAVTVAVYEGTAVVRAAGGDPIVVGAGQSRLFGGAGGDASASAGDREALEHRLAELERELDKTREALRLEQFSGALARGQLAAEQGSPAAWPPDVPAAMSTERFASELAARLEGIPDVEVEVVDCAEYPCIAALRFRGPDQSLEWGNDVADRISSWVTEVYGDDHSLSLNRSKFVSDDREARYIVFGARAASEDPNVADREKWRMSSLVEQLGEQATADEAREVEAREVVPPTQD
jgi:hypothetical protein